MPPIPRPYFSERHGRGPKAIPIDLARLKRLVFSAIDELDQRYYFQEAFGYECVDAGEVPGTVGSDINAWFLRTLHRDITWPISDYGDQYDADTLFDVLEVLHDVVSKPVLGRHHDYNNCGWHYNVFDQLSGKQEYRAALNPLLAMYEQPLEMEANGHIVNRAEPEFAQLLEAEVPAGTDEDTVTVRVEHAKSVFRSRSSSREERRHAVRELADVLEALRGEVKTIMLSKDEDDLFQLANRFAIRHNNREQRRDYDDAIWLKWAFYVYLATIHAVLRVIEREKKKTP